MEIPLQIRVDISNAFSTTQKFDTRDVIIRWIKEVGIRNNVTVIITRSDIETCKKRICNKVIFDCDKCEKYKNTYSETQSASKKCGCPFKIRPTPAKDESGWKVDVKCGVHNHGLPDRLKSHSIVGMLTRNEK